jgi:exopolysaccharide biosynthesis protein
LRIARRDELPAEPRGDLLQAGPLLVRHGFAVTFDGEDSEGFSAASEQFDSDITAGRHPRAALGVADGVLLSVVCDGRAPNDAGLSLGELADLMASLGALEAINLDGGGSASLVCDGRLLNRPREQDGAGIPGGRPVATTLVVNPG